ncbi:hypothetical protein A2239_03245 [Candidatus Uhrbacteria bacterium RIFOXYA2_FULL_40_9]|nr:MAG: hypothetical protein A2239_03245 [Candidatus Uhrbacteria bacterium RIFOXYA2_FULL_40_9]OGL96545.1 MAG: hypothetical protein A2332_00890 [Candidatus Uhrbacteria bacterium RIFOXYB2_FULL_41_18]
MIELIKISLDRVRPVLERDGGGIEFVDYEANTQTVFVKFQGACAGCPFSRLTLQQVVLTSLQEELPFLTNIKDVSSPLSSSKEDLS